MGHFLSRTNITASEPGVAGGIIYQLYPQDDGYQLYSSPGVIAPQGQIVKEWVSTHGNPSQ